MNNKNFFFGGPRVYVYNPFCDTSTQCTLFFNPPGSACHRVPRYRGSAVHRFPIQTTRGSDVHRVPVDCSPAQRWQAIRTCDECLLSLCSRRLADCERPDQWMACSESNYALATTITIFQSNRKGFIQSHNLVMAMHRRPPLRTGQLNG